MLPMVAIMLTVLMGASAFAVDIGMQRVARRDMQALADAVALDVARLLDGRTAGRGRVGRRRPAERCPTWPWPRAPTGTTTAPLGESADRRRRCWSASMPTVRRSRSATIRSPVPRGRRTGRRAGDRADDGRLRLRAAAAAVPDVRRSRQRPRRTPASGSARTPSAVDPGERRGHRLGPAWTRCSRTRFQVHGLGYHGLADADRVAAAGWRRLWVSPTPRSSMSLEGVRLGDLFEVTADVLEREGRQRGRRLAAADPRRGRPGGARRDRGRRRPAAPVHGGALRWPSTVSVLDLVAASAFAADGTHALSVPGAVVGAALLRRRDQPRRDRGALGRRAATSVSRRRRRSSRFTAEPVLHVGTVGGLAGDDVTGAARRTAGGRHRPSLLGHLRGRHTRPAPSRSRWTSPGGCPGPACRSRCTCAATSRRSTSASTSARSACRS